MSKNINIKFGENLKQLMARRNFTATELAGKLGVSGMSITRYLRGQQPSPVRVSKLATIFEVEQSELLNSLPAGALSPWDEKRAGEDIPIMLKGLDDKNFPAFQKNMKYLSEVQQEMLENMIAYRTEKYFNRADYFARHRYACFVAQDTPIYLILDTKSTHPKDVANSKPVSIGWGFFDCFGNRLIIKSFIVKPCGEDKALYDENLESHRISFGRAQAEGLPFPKILDELSEDICHLKPAAVISDKTQFNKKLFALVDSTVKGLIQPTDFMPARLSHLTDEKLEDWRHCPEVWKKWADQSNLTLGELHKILFNSFCAEYADSRTHIINVAKCYFALKFKIGLEPGPAKAPGTI